MSGRPLLLDLFCGAGGCAVGYHRAGFDVIGVDIKPMPRYPFPFVEADALDFLRGLASGAADIFGNRLCDYAAIHASPPCQRFSSASFARPNRGIVQGGTIGAEHPDLLTPTMCLLRSMPVPYVVENVPLAPLGPFCITLCGLMFGLKMFRHRRFLSSAFLFHPPHRSHKGKRVGVGGVVSMCGDGDTLRKRNGRVPSDHRSKAAWIAASGIDWMLKDELSQAIPPAYTEFIGRQLIENISPALQETS